MSAPVAAIEPHGIYAALFARDRFTSYFWGLFLAISTTEGRQYRIFKSKRPCSSALPNAPPASTIASTPPCPTFPASITVNGWTYESSILVPSQCPELVLLAKLGALDPDWEPTMLEQYVRPDQVGLGVVRSDDYDASISAKSSPSSSTSSLGSQLSDDGQAYTSRLWFREAARRIHDAGVFMEIDELDVGELETALWLAARSAESLTKGYVVLNTFHLNARSP